MQQYKELKPEEQITGLSDFTEVISALDINEMLELVVEEAPRLINGQGASIYLLPNLVPQYDGQLLDEARNSISAMTLQQDFIVLAATTRLDAKELIGKAFYTPDDGLGGWVFKHGKSLCLKDSSNEQELIKLDQNLRWLDRYQGSQHYYESDKPKPILIVPLLSRIGTIGILKIPTALNKRPFTPVLQAIATTIAQFIANALEYHLLVQEQSQKIMQLVELGAKEQAKEVIEAVTQSLPGMLNCSICQLFLSQNGGSVVKLSAENGCVMDDEIRESFSRGEGLIGWVFKTGKPLLIDNLSEYVGGQVLDDALLLQISDEIPIEEEDRYLKYIQSTAFKLPDNIPQSFLAVPVKARAGSVQGVLCAYQLSSNTRSHLISFTRSDLRLMHSFASTISLAIQNDLEKRLGEVLIKMGQYWAPNQLFELVVDNIPELVPGTGCSIYRLQRDRLATELQLVASSREGLLGMDGELIELNYEIDVNSKTGFCALARSTLVFNHYGDTEVAQENIQSAKEFIRKSYPDDLTVPLLNQKRHQIGLIQLRNGRRSSHKVREKFKTLSEAFKVRPNQGLPSPKIEIYKDLDSPPSLSFVAVPIQTKNNDLYGVITIGRPVAQSPFLPSEISLLESVSGRLAAVLHNLEMEEQRKRLLMSVAHEINTPLQGILADTANLVDELKDAPELVEMSEHNLGQIQRLHLQTETIMAVLTEQTPIREFSTHSIYRPLRVACDLFEREAAAKNCNILEPQSKGTPFPEIEMSLFDLELAFKNLIHNAVKYSYTASDGQRTIHRYVKITGRWADPQKTLYSVDIQNYGVGILREEIEQRSIFQPYHRGEQSSDRRRTGAGLGLSHARQIVEDLHHGTIDVTSEAQSGGAYLTTFTVTLPIKQPRDLDLSD